MNICKSIILIIAIYGHLRIPIKMWYQVVLKRLSVIQQSIIAYSEASHWVSNARTPLYLNKKENQTYIQTWHGTPLKRLANDMKVVRMPGTTTPKYKRNFNRETSRWDYLISPNRYSTEIFRSAFDG